VIESSFQAKDEFETLADGFTEACDMKMADRQLSTIWCRVKAEALPPTHKRASSRAPPPPASRGKCLPARIFRCAPQARRAPLASTGMP
jgi:23S rRNA (adenine2030-N6)-methyltransferase